MSVSLASCLAEPALTPDAVIARLQRDAQVDDHLRAIPAGRRDQTIAQSVQELWATSRVKVFVPILPWRQAEQALLRGEPVASPRPPVSGQRGVQTTPVVRARGNSDVLELPIDDLMDVSDDVMDVSDDVLELD